MSKGKTSAACCWIPVRQHPSRLPPAGGQGAGLQGRVWFSMASAAESPCSFQQVPASSHGGDHWDLGFQPRVEEYIKKNWRDTCLIHHHDYWWTLICSSWPVPWSVKVSKDNTWSPPWAAQYVVRKGYVLLKRMKQELSHRATHQNLLLLDMCIYTDILCSFI